MRWFYKPLEGMVTNLAVISSDAPHLVRFADQEGSVFDRITFNKNFVLEDELRRNGFTEAQDGDPYVKLFGLPSEITDTGKDRKPVYSSGKYWLN
jgi:hypothetical protein